MDVGFTVAGPGPAPSYVGYWKDLEAPPARWKRSSRALAILALTALFALPELVGGTWWLTLVISEVVVGTLVVLGAPPGHAVPGTTYFRRQIVLPAVVVAALAIFGAFLAYDDLAFGTLSLAGPPPQVLACGTVFYRTGSSIPRPPGSPLHRVGTTPSGLAVLGDASCGQRDGVWAFVARGGRLVPYQATCAGPCPADPYVPRATSR